MFLVVDKVREKPEQGGEWDGQLDSTVLYAMGRMGQWYEVRWHGTVRWTRATAPGGSGTGDGWSDESTASSMQDTPHEVLVPAILSMILPCGGTSKRYCGTQVARSTAMDFHQATLHKGLRHGRADTVENMYKVLPMYVLSWL